MGSTLWNRPPVALDVAQADIGQVGVIINLAYWTDLNPPKLEGHEPELTNSTVSLGTAARRSALFRGAVGAAAGPMLERDEIELNRHPAPASCLMFEHDLFRLFGIMLKAQTAGPKCIITGDAKEARHASPRRRV
jgi:hypothetical protein